jgi:hypothetical protein
VSPTRHGIFWSPNVRKWWCPAHEHLAEPGDLEPRRFEVKLSPIGVPIPADPVEDARDRAREESERAQRRAEAETRAVEAADERESKRLRDVGHRRELPEHLRRIT